MLFKSSRILLLTTIGALLSFVGICGCASLINRQESAVSRISAMTGEHDTPAGPTISVVHLEVAVVTQPVNDRRLRSLVWEELDESGLMEPAQRMALNESGVRVGVSGGNLSWPLESLLNDGDQSDRSEIVTDEFAITDPMGLSDSQNHQSRFGSMVSLVQDSRNRISLRGPVREIEIPLGDNEQQSTQSFTNARMMLEVSIRDQRDEWVELEFQPQIHHGNTTARYTVAEHGEQMPLRQNLSPFYEQQFNLKLHRDEVAVVGRLADKQSIGDALFVDDAGPASTEKLVIVRLVGIEQVTGKSSGGMAEYRRD